MRPTTFLIYGATGYTGALIARHAVERGLQPVLVGRTAGKLAPFATSLGCSYRTARLDDPAGLDAAFADTTVLLNCAGPFGMSGGPLAEACLRTGTHYLDLAGEVPEFTAMAERDGRATSAGVMLLPGVGFGVVPTDCLALYLAKRLPDATHLTLAFETVGGVSQGTAHTLFKDLMTPGVTRRAGALVEAWPAARRRRIDFGAGEKTAVTNPWRGDLVTAFWSTGIGEIETLSAFPPPVPQLMRASRLLRSVWNARPVQGLLDRLIARLPPGPDERALDAGHSHCWGEAVAADGRRVAARLHGPEAYHFTALTALAVVERVLAGEARPGFQTPARVLGEDFVLGVAGVRREDVAS